jgi:hypothetical protein
VPPTASCVVGLSGSQEEGDQEQRGASANFHAAESSIRNLAREWCGSTASPADVLPQVSSRAKKN